MIYFLQPLQGGPIKIGTTDDLERRQRQLESHYGYSLVLLAVLSGSYSEEKSIHERFDHLRFSGTEQFRPERDLMEFIGRPLFAKKSTDITKEIYVKFVPVKVDRILIGKAQLIAKHRGISVAELISEMVRGPIEKAYGQLLHLYDEKGERES